MDNGTFWSAIIASLVSLIGSLSILVIAWRKARPEIGALQQSSNASEADAAETALRSTELATRQLIGVQEQLYQEQKKRVELEKQVNDMQIEIQKMIRRITRLEAQVVSLGKEPVE